MTAQPRAMTLVARCDDKGNQARRRALREFPIQPPQPWAESPLRLE